MFDVFYIDKSLRLFAHERKCDSIEHAQQLSRTRYFWIVNYLCDYRDFDFIWEPPPWQSHFRHAWASQWQQDSGTYLVPRSGYRDTVYHDELQIIRNTDHTLWHIPTGIDPDSVDHSWHPNPLDPPYIYHFPSQHQPVSGVTYTVPGARDIKIMTSPGVRSLPTHDHWHIPTGIDPDSVDHSWHPNPLDPPYIYHFPDQHQPVSGVTYTVPGAIGVNILIDPKVKSLSRPDLWHIPDGIDPDSVDHSWHPNPLDPPYIYHFPDQHQPVSGVTYTVPGARDIKIMTSPGVRSLPTHDHWHIPNNIVGFDYSWHPNPLDPPYTHEFGTQWYDEGGPVYDMPGAESRKYHNKPKATLSSSQEHWHRLYEIDESSFDWSWRPHPRDPAYIYVWGNQHWPAEKMPTLEYRVPGATERKYMPSGPRLASCRENWIVPDDIDETTVDFSWRPDPGDDAYIYEFATQWQRTGGACYVVAGATERKYMPIIHQRRATSDDAWEVLEDIDNFDFSWHPDSTEPPYIYVFGNQHYPGTIMPTIRYHVPGATQEKFLDSPRARLLPSMTNWEILEPINQEIWDWSWRPDPTEPPYIYIFGNQWNPAEYKASVRYATPGATQIKYMEPRTQRLPDAARFTCKLAVRDFDYSWEPNPFDPPMTYVFGNQWNPAVLEPTVIYSTGGTEIKYMDFPVAALAPNSTDWRLLDEIEYFDYSWRPNPRDPPFIYVFGNQWLPPEQRPALEYPVPGAIERKYMTEPRATRSQRQQDFVINHECKFDFSWEPDPGSPPYIYVFGNQWWPAEIMPTVEYHVDGATQRKYMHTPVAQLLPNEAGWRVVAAHEFEFDRSWRPDPGSPPYIYVFGNQWWSPEQMSTIEYHMPGATERKFMSDPVARILPDRALWSVPEEIDQSMIDYSWIPDPQEPPYIYHFATDYQISVGLTYTVPGAKDVKFAGAPPVLEKEKPVVKTLDIFYMDRSNAMSALRFQRLKERYPDIQRVRYVNSVMDTISRCLTKTQSMRFWVIGSENDYTEFDFAWHAQPWQTSMTHVFGSQWNKWSDTFLINRWEFERQSKWASGIEEFSNLNFVSDQKVIAPADAVDIYMIDFDNAESDKTYQFLTSRYRVVKTARYFDNYLDTLRRIISNFDSEHIWVTSSMCDYERFDFSWQPEAWQRNMLHVFPSDDQKFGDTFYVPVQALREQIGIELLDWFDTINYCEDQRAHRWPLPVIHHDQDSHVEIAKTSTFKGPLVLFSDGASRIPKKIPAVCLWRSETKTMVPLDPGGGSVIVPRAALEKIQTQFYDYPYIDRSYKNLLQAPPLDIVFISNGEYGADHHWQVLNECVSKLPNRVHRVDGVKGRVAAYQAAARVSDTPWFFAVFAKLQVNPDFDWAWQPDRMQQPKHYIFHAYNPVNHLIYGHQAVIAYNRSMVLANTGQGLDFTLEQAHEVVPMVSGTAYYDNDPWTCWRTAFRECVKLRHSLPDVENEYRLQQWIDIGEGANGHWSRVGAQDAIDYYQSVDGNFSELKKSYEWDWLASYALLLHPDLLTQSTT